MSPSQPRCPRPQHAFSLDPATVESGRGRCPHEPDGAFASTVIGGLPSPGTSGCRAQGPGPVPVPPAGGGRGLSGCLCQVGSSTPASLRTSSAETPASSAARGRAPPCAPRWTSACSTVTAPRPHGTAWGAQGGKPSRRAFLARSPLSRAVWRRQPCPFSPSDAPSSLVDPKFVAAYLIPDNDDRDNDKAYFFFTEKVVEADGKEHAVVSRVARVCVVRRQRHRGEHHRGWGRDSGPQLTPVPARRPFLGTEVLGWVFVVVAVRGRWRRRLAGAPHLGGCRGAVCSVVAVALMLPVPAE